MSLTLGEGCPVRCSACGHETRAGARFCDECGTALATPGAADRPVPASVGAGRYHIEHLLGEGSRKRVYFATDMRLDRAVAVALIKTEGLDDAGRRRVEREARAMARLGEHPNIVAVFDVDEDDGTPFIVSQYMSGGTVADLLVDAGGPLPIEQVLRIGMEVAAALAHAHEAGVVHRDVKPANVWLATNGAARLGDFGLAVANDQSRLTSEGMIVGTVSYLAPEQATGRAPEPAADLYALGAFLYELCTGRPPFAGDDAVAVITQHLHTAPVAPGWYNGTVPKAVATLILKLLEKDPDRRPPSALDVVDALEQARRDARDPGPAGVARVPLPVAADRLVGRAAELDALRAAVDGALAGSGRLVMVVGEPGIGKTRLVEEAAGYAAMRGARVWWGHAYEGEVGVPYLPFIEALRSHVRARSDEELRDDLGTTGPEVATFVPELHQRFPDLPRSAPLDGAAERLRLFDGVTSFLQHASRSTPVVLVLDDLHWADKPTLLLLQYMVRNLHDDRVLIIGTYRDVDLDRRHPLAEALVGLRREPLFERVLLRGLERDGVKVLIEVIGDQPAPDGFADMIFRETEGNPFFVTEILRHLAESGALRRVDGRWAGTPDSIAENLPEGVREVIGRRLDRLSDPANRTLTVAAAMPGGFTLDVVAAVTGDDDDVVLDLLDEALAAQVVRERAGSSGTFEFTHALIRQTLYGELNTPRRVRLHRQIGEALEGLPGADLGALAYHWLQAAPSGAAEKALGYATSAADRATGQVAYEEAARFYELALQALEFTDTVDPRRRAELLLAQGTAARQAGETETADGALREMATIVRRLGDPLLLARCALARAELSWTSSGSDREKIDVLEEALAALPASEEGLRAHVLSALGNELAFIDAARHEDFADEAVAAARRSGDNAALVEALRSWTFRPRTPEEVEKARIEIDRLSSGSGDLGQRLWNLGGWFTNAMMLWDRARFDAVTEELRRVADEARAPFWRANALLAEATRASIAGRFADAEFLLDEMLVMGRRIRQQGVIDNYGVAILPIRREQRRLGELERSTRRAVESFPTIAAWRIGLAVILLDGDRLDEAAIEFEVLAADDFAAVAHDVVRTYTLHALAEVAVALEDRSRAEQLYAHLLPVAGRPVLIGMAAHHGAVEATLGTLAAVIGRHDIGVTHFEAALRQLDGFGARVAGARARYDFARLFADRSGPEDEHRALVLCNDALDEATELGLTRLVEDAMPLKLALQGLDSSVDVARSIEAVSSAVVRDRPDLRDQADASGRVTIAFSDIEGYSELTDRLGDARVQEVLRSHNELLRAAVARFGGTEVKCQGDGFMLAFPDPGAGVRCALAVQAALENHDFGTDAGRVRVRIGIHTGEVIREGDDFYGRTVILAARVTDAAHGGEVLVTDAVADAVAPAGLEVVSAREVTLKGLSGTHRVHRVATH